MSKQIEKGILDTVAGKKFCITDGNWIGRYPSEALRDKRFEERVAAKAKAAKIVLDAAKAKEAKAAAKAGKAKGSVDDKASEASS